MSHGIRPTYQQTLDIMRLMADVAALKNTPPLQRQVLIDGLNEIIGTNQAIFTVADDWLPGQKARFSHQTVARDPDPLYLRYLAEQFAGRSVQADAFCDYSINDLSPVQCWWFERVLPNRAAERKYDLFTEVRREARCREGMVSVARLNHARIIGLAMHQFGGAAPPTQRQRALAVFAIGEIKRLVEKGHVILPPSQPAEMPARLRQILDRLLSGQNPKRIALELGLSIWTVREHMQRIYRHFGVSGREELAAQYIVGRIGSEHTR